MDTARNEAVIRRVVSEWNRFFESCFNSTQPKRKVAQARWEGVTEIAHVAMGLPTPTSVTLAIQDGLRRLGARPTVIFTSPSTSIKAREWDDQLTQALMKESY